MVAWRGLGLGNVWLSLLFLSVVFGAIYFQEVFQLRPLCLIPYLTRVRRAVGAAEQAFGYPVFSFLLAIHRCIVCRVPLSLPY